MYILTHNYTYPLIIIMIIKNMYFFSLPFSLFSPHPASSSSSLSFPKEPPPVLSLLTYNKGFICSGGNGTLHLFEKTEDRNTFKRARSVSIWVDPAIHVEQPAVGSGSSSNEVICLTLSPSEENVVCSTRSQQLYNLTLSAADLDKVLAVHLCTCTCKCV